MKVKLLTGNPEVWVEYECTDLRYVLTCKRCLQPFDSPQKERIYCGDKCQFATWNDNRILKPTGQPTVKSPSVR